MHGRLVASAVFKTVVSSLARDRLVEHVTIETHCLPLIENSQKNLQRVRQILQRLNAEGS